MPDEQDRDGAHLSKGTRDLLRAHIFSIEQLNLLLWLRANAPMAHAAGPTAAALGIPEAVVASDFAHLERHGLVRKCQSSPPTVQYMSRSAELAAEVDRLAELHACSQSEVLAFVSACALERVRDAQDRAFAHAYLAHGSKKHDP